MYSMAIDVTATEKMLLAMNVLPSFIHPTIRIGKFSKISHIPELIGVIKPKIMATPVTPPDRISCGNRNILKAIAITMEAMKIAPRR